MAEGTVAHIDPGGFWGPLVASANALEGKMEEAMAALTEARRINPLLTLKWLQTHASNMPQQLMEGLRKAGLPEE